MIAFLLDMYNIWTEFSGVITGIVSLVAILFSLFATLSPLGERDRFYKLLEGEVFQRAVKELVDMRIAAKNLATKDDISHLNEVVHELREDIKYLIRKNGGLS
jgi:hypothetical protein